METISILLSSDDLTFLCNTIGETYEVVKGDEVAFRARTGETYSYAQEVRVTLQKIREAELTSLPGANLKSKARRFNLSIVINDLRFLRSTINETLKAIEEWEFHTRTGETIEEAIGLLNRIQETLDNVENE